MRPNPSDGAVPPISEAQQIEIARAEEREKKLSFARKLAGFNGVAVGVFAFFSLLSALFDPWSLGLAVPLAAIAFIELRGARQVASYERNGFVLLAANQLALIALVTIYALIRIRSALHDPSPLTELMAESGGLPEELGGGELGDFDELYRSAAVGFYGVVIAVTALSQGACALYYWSRIKHLDELLARTPAWAIDWLRARQR